MRRALELLSAQGIDPQPLLRRAGLAGVDPANRDLVIPVKAEARLIELAASETGDAAFGIRMAEGADPRDAGLLYYLFSAAATLRQALALLARYVHIANAGLDVRLMLPPNADGIVEFAYIGLRRLSLNHATEYQLAVVIRMLREILGRSVSPSSVGFAHRRSFGVREVERFFGCPVQYAATADRVVFLRETLELPTLYADARLLEILQAYGERIPVRRAAKASFRVAVENELQKLLPNGPTRIDEIADALGVSSRSLSRRLAEESTSFSEVLEGLRRTLSLQYLADPALSIDRTANLLGYGDAGAFSHAFRRWTGRSPSQARSDPAIVAQAVGDLDP